MLMANSRIKLPFKHLKISLLPLGTEQSTKSWNTLFGGHGCKVTEKLSSENMNTRTSQNTVETIGENEAWNDLLGLAEVFLVLELAVLLKDSIKVNE